MLTRHVCPIKKIAITALLGMSVIGLTGCGVEYAAWRDKATQVEISIVEGVNQGSKHNSCNVSRERVKKAIFKRNVKPQESQKPFQDIKGVVKVEQSTWKCNGTRTTYEEFYRLVFNEELFDHTNEDTFKYVNTKDTNTVVVENGNTQEEILSPKIIDEITEASAKCFSAKVKMVDIIDDKGYLTKQDYPEIMKLISKCKMHKLKIEVERM